MVKGYTTIHTEDNGKTYCYASDTNGRRLIREDKNGAYVIYNKKKHYLDTELKWYH